jgi:phosphatidylinositol 3-kinase
VFQLFSHVSQQTPSQLSTAGNISTSTQATAPQALSSFAPEHQFWAVIDPDIARENPVEDKHRRLVRSHRSSPWDRELKPNAKLRDELGVCIVHFVNFWRSGLSPRSANTQLRTKPAFDF